MHTAVSDILRRGGWGSGSRLHLEPCADISNVICWKTCYENHRLNFYLHTHHIHQLHKYLIHPLEDLKLAAHYSLQPVLGPC